jgi:DNA sulfur modification protein DndE
METPIERIRLSTRAKEQLIKLKRLTKIEQWNILCRWAFCYSLAEPSIPSSMPINLDSNVEMNWNVFGGEIADILLLALKKRCDRDGLETNQENLKMQFLLHLHRGIGYLASELDLKNIDDLVAMTVEATGTLQGGTESESDFKAKP